MAISLEALNGRRLDKEKFAESEKLPREASAFWGPETKEAEQKLHQLAAATIRALTKIYDNTTSSNPWLPLVEKIFQTKEGKVIADILQREAREGRKFTPNFAGQIHPQGNIVAQIGSVIGEILNTNAIVAEVSPVEMQLEKEALSWLMGIFHLDSERGSGIFTSGGTLANMAALLVAREAFRKHHSDVIRRGGKAVIIAPHTAHYSIDKIAKLLGGLSGQIAVRRVGLRGNLSTDPNQVAEAVKEVRRRGDEVMAILGIGGSTEFGIIDPLEDLAAIAQQHHIFFMVDAAYGGPFILSKQAPLFAGIEKADAITIDPHKMLYVPYAAGAVLFKQREYHALMGSLINQVRYLETDENSQNISPQVFREDPNDIRKRIEGSMGTGGIIATWASIRYFGREGFANIYNHLIDLSEYLYQLAQQSKLLQPIAAPQTNALCLKIRSAPYNRQLVQAARASLERRNFYVGKTELPTNNGQEIALFKIIIMHPRTSKEKIDQLFTNLEEAVRVNL